MPRKKPSYEASLCAGHLLVWTWRKLLAGQEHCPLLRTEYRRIAGDDAESLLTLFANFLQALGRGSRRMLSVGPPHAASLTPDEVQVLRLAAAAQAVDAPRLEANLAWMVKREGQPAARAAILLLMARFRECQVVLPPVTQALPPVRPMLEVVWSGHEKSGGSTAGFSENKLTYR